MEQKLRDFVRSEIMNRFLANRPDFPRSDVVKINELAQHVVEVLTVRLPSLEPIMEVCALYEKVDEVADDLIKTYAVQRANATQITSSSTSNQDSTVLLRSSLPPQDRFPIELFSKANQQLLREHLFHRNLAGGQGSAQQHAVLPAQIWEGLNLGSMEGSYITGDQESCGSTDTALADI
ncbi:hypothetical protein BSKO_11861 [Bryopsis sp. KO-2023]|nr:hypothetical protein BSKO_11861 [Bryopsis sp. KO-2023]